MWEGIQIMKSNKWICTNQWRMITVGTVVMIEPLSIGNQDNMYGITPEGTQRTRYTNYTTIKEYFKEYKEEK